MPHHRPKFRIAHALGLALIASSACAESDVQVYESAIAEAARICPGHSAERTKPGIRAVKVGALRVLAERRVTLCPDRRLDVDKPLVWYGGASVFAWNPQAKGAVELLAGKVDAMTRKEEFPVETLVWNADGSEAKGATVPAFEARPRPVGAY